MRLDCVLDHVVLHVFHRRSRQGQGNASVGTEEQEVGRSPVGFDVFAIQGDPQFPHDRITNAIGEVHSGKRVRGFLCLQNFSGGIDVLIKHRRDQVHVVDRSFFDELSITGQIMTLLRARGKGNDRPLVLARCWKANPFAIQVLKLEPEGPVCVLGFSDGKKMSLAPAIGPTCDKGGVIHPVTVVAVQ